MRTVAVLSLKGGVGKTSVVLGLAGAATAQGLATLVIDCDPQCNATSILAAELGQPTIADVLERGTRGVLETALSRCAWEVGPGEVDVIAGDPRLVNLDAWGRGTWRPRLAPMMGWLSGYDLVLFDCPPSLGALTREALAASDRAVIVTSPSFFANQGAQRAIMTVSEIVESHNARLRLAGIIVNRVRSNAEEHTFRIRELTRDHGRAQILQPVIPERIALQKAESTGQPVHTLGTQSARDVASAFRALLPQVMA